jgi:aryl-alcohol dehydrogenase-like predicted oxidoreductase
MDDFNSLNSAWMAFLQLNFKMQRYLIKQFVENSFKIMDRFAEFGGNFIDTADIYGPFNSEQIGMRAPFPFVNKN